MQIFNLLILYGGYSGLAATNRLERRGIESILLKVSPTFVVLAKCRTLEDTGIEGT